MIKKYSTNPLKSLALCLMLASYGQAALAESVPEQYLQQLSAARDQLHSGQGQAAYKALLPLEGTLAGYPSFDLMFGQAALTAHEDTRALMAFERCLAVSPKMGDCR